MSKTKTISVVNFKAIDALEVNFNGCTAIVTAGNDKGKSTFLKGITERLRGVKPKDVVKDGEKEGKATLELTSGEKFVWEFDISGKDKLTFFTKENYKAAVTKAIVTRFFPPTFDIDKFLNDSPKEQYKQLQKVLGVDFTDIDCRYNVAYNDRTEKNKEAEKFHVKLSQMIEAPKVEAVNLEDLQTKKEGIKTKINKLYQENIAENKKRNDAFKVIETAKRKEIKDLNLIETNKQKSIDTGNTIKASLEKFLSENKIEKLVDYSKLSDYIISLPAPGIIFDEEVEVSKLTPPVLISPEYPDDKEIEDIDKLIVDASENNVKHEAYVNYVTYKESVDIAKLQAVDADNAVKQIEAERQLMLESIKMPQGIAFVDGQITVDGFSLDKSQISTSKLYIAALRIASLNIGECRTLYFDASFLDNNNLAEIQKWANENDLQLLIERPALEGGDIKYEIIETK